MAEYTLTRASGALPLLGHAVRLVRDPLGFLASLPGQGDLVEVKLGPVHAYVACHAELVHQVLVNDRVFDKGGAFSDNARKVFGNGVATCAYQDHRRQRRLVQPAFHRGRLDGYLTVMGEQANALSQSWHDGQIIDVPAMMNQFTISVTARTLFPGTNSMLNTTDVARRFSAMTDGLDWRMMLPTKLLGKVPTPGNRRFNWGRQKVRELADAIIAEHRHRGEDNGSALSILVRARDGDQAMSDDELRDQVLTFCAGAFGTTAMTLAWAFNFLGHRRDLQEQLHDEAESVLADRTPRHDDLARLDLTNSVITETLRISPPGWLLTRKTTTRTQLGGHPLPPGTVLICSPYCMGRHRDLYQQPAEFNPDRWRHDRGRTLPRGAVVPFSAGARKCMGDEFAMAMAATAMTAITRRWRLEHLPGAVVRPAPRGLLTPRPLRMRLHQRRCGGSTSA